MEQRDLFYRLRGAFREKGLLRGGRGARPLIGDDAGLLSDPHRIAGGERQLDAHDRTALRGASEP